MCFKRFKSILKCVSAMSNWKTPGPDGVQGFWFIRMANLHDQLAKYLEVCVCVYIFFHREGFFRLQDVQDIPEGTDQRSCVVNIS